MNRPFFKKASVLLGVCVAYTVLFLSFYNVIRYNHVFPYAHVTVACRTFITNFIPIFTIFALAYLEFMYIPAYRGHMMVKWIRDLCLMAGNMLCVNFLFKLLTGLPLDWGGAVFNAIFIFLGIEVHYYFIRYKESLLQEAAQNEEILRYRYRLLKAQVNPHFLFNSLNTLNSLVSLDRAKAQYFILSLAKFYRYITEHEEDNTIPLGKELAFMDTYIDLLKIRYVHQLEVSVRQEEGVDTSRMLIPFTLQLLLENVTKHNVISTKYPMHVSVEIGTDGLTVTNRIQLKTTGTGAHTGIGTRYLRELYAMHGKQFRVLNDGIYFTAKVPYL